MVGPPLSDGGRVLLGIPHYSILPRKFPADPWRHRRPCCWDRFTHFLRGRSRGFRIGKSDEIDCRSLQKSSRCFSEACRGRSGGFAPKFQSMTVQEASERTASSCVKSTTCRRQANYEPRGRGFDSCRPHHYFDYFAIRIAKRLTEKKSHYAFNSCKRERTI